VESRVARRYATALFNAAEKADVIKSVESDLDGIVYLLRNKPEFRHFLLSPYVAREEKMRIADKLFSDRVTALTMQALRLLLEKRREGELEGMRAHFIRLRRLHENIIHAVITSAKDLSDEQRKRIVDRLESRSGKSVEPEYRVDPHLLGGVKVNWGNYVLDGTVRGSLNRLRETLRYDLLKQN
jgi:F-type H+-transporting ATPase subunit delta